MARRIAAPAPSLKDHAMNPAHARRPHLLPIALAMGVALTPMLALAQADGTPGNPAGTALSRTLDRVTGAPTIPDGTPGNPPGTALGRAAGQAAPVLPSAAPATALLPPVTMTPGAAAVARPRLSQIIGGHVYNERNERVGEVDDILLSLPGTLGSPAGIGPIAIIQVGGFLGMGGRLVTLPLGDLRWNAEREQILMPGATKESLGARPAFEYNMLRAR
jgi:hypothetical protein